jgi:7,8-didemethyl-8-hydroxy-5-deazariboflavin synthase, CofG subunit
MKGRPITYSKNIFIPVTNVCRNKCTYCGFRRPADHKEAFLITEQEAEAVFKKGAETGCTEAMFAFGESPEENAGFNARFKKQLNDAGFETVVDYTAHLCRLALDYGLLPHVNGGVLSFEELKMIAPLNASMGLMLETTAIIPAHKDCPGKIPAVRLEMIENAGKLKMPFTTGLLAGIGENQNDRLLSLLEIQKLHEKYGHIQEVILQNYTPNSGQTVLSTASATPAGLKPPTKQEMIDLILLAKKILSPDISIQVAPNLMSPIELIQYGVTDLGGISPVTIDYINPESAWPEIENLRHLLRSKGYELKERLPIYPRYVKTGAGGTKTKLLIKSLADDNGYRLNLR